MKLVMLTLFFSLHLVAAEGPTKEQLHDMLLVSLPDTMCQKDLIFTECYSVTIKECKALVSKSVTPCFKQYENKISANINREQFIKIADEIGQCVGNNYSKVLQEENKQDKVCSNAIKWTN